MTRYKMDDGIIVDTDLATAVWQEATDCDGNNHISRATGSQWEHETLYRSAKGRYYIERTSQWSGSRPSAAWVEPEEAAAWLLAMDKDLPEDLAEYEDGLIE